MTKKKKPAKKPAKKPEPKPPPRPKPQEGDWYIKTYENAFYIANRVVHPDSASAGEYYSSCDGWAECFILTKKRETAERIIDYLNTVYRTKPERYYRHVSDDGDDDEDVNDKFPDSPLSSLEGAPPTGGCFYNCTPEIAEDIREYLQLIARQP